MNTILLYNELCKTIHVFDTANLPSMQEEKPYQGASIHDASAFELISHYIIFISFLRLFFSLPQTSLSSLR